MLEALRRLVDPLLIGLAHLFSKRSPGEVAIDVVDIAVVAFVVYRALLLMRGTRALQMATGLVLLWAVESAAQRIGLTTLYDMLSALLSSVVLIIVVVFQNDIRRVLMRLGTRTFFARLGGAEAVRAVDEVVAAATTLARHRMGAIICFEQEASLADFVSSPGAPIDAAMHRELLVGLFVPEGVNELHDGAVIVRNFRIAEAGTFFPMPEGLVNDRAYGSRHRAAVGITEETDAVVVVVSEERGTISLAFGGNLISNLDGPALRATLQRLLGIAASAPREARDGRESRDGRADDGETSRPLRLPRPPTTPIAPRAAAVTTPAREAPSDDDVVKAVAVESVRTTRSIPPASPIATRNLDDGDD
jgi:diadenylate cyclase